MKDLAFASSGILNEDSTLSAHLLLFKLSPVRLGELSFDGVGLICIKIFDSGT